MHFVLLILCLGVIYSPSAAATKAQGYFGAQLGLHDSNQGVVIVAALPGSPAALAGLQVDDVIISVDSRPFDNVETLATYLRQAGAGSRVEVSYLRNNKANTTSFDLGHNPWQDADQVDERADLSGVNIVTDLAYGEASPSTDRHRLDVYTPTSEESVPALLWIHGGGWSFGDKSNERALALRFAERGIAVVAVNYRLSSGRWADANASADGVTHPAHINDVADAFAWLHAQAETLGIDNKRLFVGGHSAGGHLAALLASDASYLKERGLTLDDIAGALPIGGAYDIKDYHAALIASDPQLGEAHIHAVFGTSEAKWEHASPTTYLNLSHVPMLVIVEDQAGFQRYASQLMEAANAAQRSNIRLFPATGRTHGNVLLLMQGKHDDSVRARMIEFMERAG